jgi:hypothetical protein
LELQFVTYHNVDTLRPNGILVKLKKEELCAPLLNSGFRN